MTDTHTIHMSAAGIAHHSYGDTTSHHTMPVHKLVIPLDAPITLVTEGGKPEAIHSPIWVPAQTPQIMGCEGHTLALFWETTSSPGAQLGPSLLGQQIQPISGRRARTLQDLAKEAVGHLGDPDAMHQTLHEVAKRLAPHPSTTSLDPRIDTLLRQIQAHPTEPLSQERAARLVHLSSSRLSHLFRQETGLSYKRYILWRRLRFALGTLLQSPNTPITTIAHHAGFSDHAHFTRTATRLIGQPPSYLKLERHK